MLYNIALIVVLVMFLIFAAACGQSLGNMYCARNDEDRRDAQFALIFNLLFAGLLGWWAYYEYNRHKACFKLIVVETNKKYEVDPNMVSSVQKRLDEDKKRSESLSTQVDESSQGLREPQPREFQGPQGRERIIRRELNLSERLQATDQRGDTMNTPGMLI
jgi:hypothetical protein